MKVALWALAGFVLGAALVVLVAGVIVPAVWTNTRPRKYIANHTSRHFGHW